MSGENILVGVICCQSFKSVYDSITKFYLSHDNFCSVLFYSALNDGQLQSDTSHGQIVGSVSW